MRRLIQSNDIDRSIITRCQDYVCYDHERRGQCIDSETSIYLAVHARVASKNLIVGSSVLIGASRKCDNIVIIID